MKKHGRTGDIKKHDPFLGPAWYCTTLREDGAIVKTINFDTMHDAWLALDVWTLPHEEE
jgi:hypothetical protein